MIRAIYGVHDVPTDSYLLNTIPKLSYKGAYLNYNAPITGQGKFQGHS